MCIRDSLEGSGFISWDFIPEFPTFASFRKLLFYSPQFFMLFWNSIKMVLLILAGQLLVSVPAAWAFAVYKFPFRKILFTLYIVPVSYTHLMLRPAAGYWEPIRNFLQKRKRRLDVFLLTGSAQGANCSSGMTVSYTHLPGL